MPSFITSGTPTFILIVHMCVCSVILTLGDPMDCSSPGSSVHGIFQARILKWGAISTPGDLADSGIEPNLLLLLLQQADSLPLSHLGSTIYSFITACQRFLSFTDLSLLSNVIDCVILFLLFQHPCGREERTGRVHSDSCTHGLVTRSHFSPVCLTIKLLIYFSYFFLSKVALTKIFLVLKKISNIATFYKMFGKQHVRVLHTIY